VQDQSQNTPNVKASSAPTIQAPTIAKPPSNRAGNDEGEFGERHERGERGSFGDDD
jgi:hypothetical protein